MAKVGVIGLPVFATYECSDTITGIPGVAIQKSREWAEGATSTARRDLMGMLESQVGLQTHDLGELLIRNTDDPSLAVEKDDYFVAVTKAYSGLGEIAKERIRGADADIVLVIGGDHSGALPLYSLPGNVVRLDAHGDAYGAVNGNTDFLVLNGATYMNFVKEGGLKEERYVANAGIMDFFVNRRGILNDGKNDYPSSSFCFGRVLAPEVLMYGAHHEITFLDIDVDVISREHGLPHPFETSVMSAEGIAVIIRRLKPSVVGLFECIQKDGTMPPDIVSSYPDVFLPICSAVADVAAYRSQEKLRLEMSEFHHSMNGG